MIILIELIVFIIEVVLALYIGYMLDELRKVKNEMVEVLKKNKDGNHV